MHLAGLDSTLLFFGQRVRVDDAELVFGLEVLLQDAWRVDGVVFFRCIGARKLEDDLGAARVLGEKVGYIVDGAVEDDPAAVGCVVLGD